jgi:flagellin
MATEMTKFTKFQILQQSGVSMLSQANKSPQAVLSLLNG